MVYSSSKNTSTLTSGANRRLNILYSALVFLIVVCAARLFYLLIVRHDHYQRAAYADQLKQYAIPAERGIIEARESDGSLVPLVLNQKLYTLYGDPTFIKKVSQSADKIAPIVGGNSTQLAKLMQTKNTRYVVLAKKINQTQNDI